MGLLRGGELFWARPILPSRISGLEIWVQLRLISYHYDLKHSSTFLFLYVVNHQLLGQIMLDNYQSE